MNQLAPVVVASPENGNSKAISLKDIGIVSIALIAQCLWTSIFISTKVGLLNCLPSLVFLGMWYWFTKLSLGIKYSRWYFLLGFLITLRLPITIAPQLEFVSWILYLSIISLIGYKFFEYFKNRQQLIVLYLATAIILFNSFTHLFLDSPFTYSFRLANQLPSNYITGQDNNLTWECSYESSNLAVHCDTRHYIPSEKIFSEPNYDASFSVFLNRFFYGYLNSLVGVQGHRWFMSFSLNVFIWISTCVAVYRIAEIAKLSERAQKIAMLCCASSWGFVHFVAQPSPHIAAFASASIILWATLELISDELINYPLLILLIVSGSLTYDIYPLILISSLLFFIHKRLIFGVSIPLLSISLNVFWKYISLQQILGTIGDIQSISSPSSNLTYSFQNWAKVILSLNFGRFWQLLSNGFMTYLYGGMILGTIASTGLLIYLAINKKDEPNYDDNKLLFTVSACFCTVMLIAMFLVAAQSEIWSPTKLIPRFAFYIYPVNTLAIAFFADKYINRWGYVAPIATFVVANSTLIKLASISAFFEYGLVGLYWQ